MGGKTSTASKMKYNAKTYDRVVISVHKGVKEQWQIVAESVGESLTGYIREAVLQRIARESK